MRRRSGLAVLAAACALLAAGCADVSRSSIDAMRLSWRGQPKLAPTAEQIAAKPHYQMRATTARGDAVLILGNVDGERQLWYGKDGVIVVLQHGRVVQTMGLAENLDGSRGQVATDPFRVGLHTLNSPQTYTRIDDWSPRYRYGVTVRGELKAAGSDDIEILGRQRRVLLVTEDVAARDANFHATNRYWVDPADGFVWMSEQHVLPGLRMRLVQLRPYRGDKA